MDTLVELAKLALIVVVAWGIAIAFTYGPSVKDVDEENARRDREYDAAMKKADAPCSYCGTKRKTYRRYICDSCGAEVPEANVPVRPPMLLLE